MNKLQEIKKLLALGVSKAYIARKLNISRQAVYDYLKGVYKPKKPPTTL